MAWSFTHQTLLDAAARRTSELKTRSGSLTFESLGRTHRWLDDPESAREWFRRAAEDLEQGFTASGLGTGNLWARTGGLLVLAGERESGRSRLERSLAERQGVLEGEDRAGVLYLLGRLDDAVAASSGPVAGLAAAKRDGDLRGLTAAREELLRLVRSDRCGPHRDGPDWPWTTWDWIEETFVVETALRGEPTPTHAEMLARTGLLKEKKRGGKPPKPPTLPALGTKKDIALEASDGADVVAMLEVDEDHAVICTLDPREDRGLVVILEPLEGAWGAEVREHIDDSGEWMFGHELGSADEAADAAVDWLRVNAPEPYGGRWAADALRTVYATLD